MDATGPYTITVLSGVNAGAEVRRAAGRGVIGRGDNADVQLDSGADQAINFMFRGDKIYVRPMDGDARAEPGGRCSSSKVTKLDLPVQVELNDGTRFHMARIANGGVRTRKLTFGMVSAGAAAAVAVMLWPTTEIVIPLQQAAAVPVVQVPEMAAPSPEKMAKATCETCMDDAKAFLDTKVAEAGLHSLTIKQNGSMLRLAGAIAPDSLEQLRMMLRSYDSAWGQRVRLLTDYEIKEVNVPLVIANIWLGDVREVTTDSGEIYRIGDIVGDGWKIMEIESGMVDLERDDTRLRLTTP